MDADKINRWLTLGANLGVLVGLLLLITELKQNAEFAQFQFASNSNALSEEIQLAMLGSEPAIAWSKSVLDPASLSEPEIKVLDVYHSLILNRWLRTRNMVRQGYLEEGTTARWIRSQATFFFGNDFAKLW